MNTLFDAIKQNRSQLAGQQAPVTDETSRVQSLLRAKSGKQVAGGGAAAPSNLGEQAAVQQTNQQFGQLAVGQQLQQKAEDQAVAGQQQEAQLQRQEIDQAKRFQTVQNQMKTNQLLNELSRDRATLDLEKDRARLEQTSFLLALQDKKYTDDLQDIAKRRRLDDAAVFQREMEEMAFGDSLDLLKQKLGGQDILAANDRDYRKALSALSIQDAMQVAEMEMAAEEKAGALDREALKSGAILAAKTANTASMYGGIGKLTEAGIQVYDKYADKESPNKPSDGGAS